MEQTNADRFSFVSRAVPEDTFSVVSFEGREALSACYRFDITLVATQPDLDLGDVLQKPAVFTIRRNSGDLPFHGILAEFEQRQAFHEYVVYQAALVPRFWWLSLGHHNRIFLNDPLPSILKGIFEDGGLTNQDYSIRLKRDYPPLEYVCQYDESNLDFAARWMERDGIYYYFEQTPDYEKLILTDTGIAHTGLPEADALRYAPPTGLDASSREEVIHFLTCRQKQMPRKVILKDYNYRTPSVDLSGEAIVRDQGRGDVFIYGDHFRTPEEGRELARIRAEDLLCRERLYLGEGAAPFMRPGYTFDLTGHYRQDFNRSYLAVEVEHRGGQAGFLTAGLREQVHESESEPYYRNSFTLIPSDVQYRPERRTERARFFGIMNAVVDSAGSGAYADLDAEGRYAVILPFDLSGRSGGKASSRLRMAQPYAGEDHGMHFPLHKGAEVLLSFIDGDPDRPIIVGAVPNAGSASVVGQANLTNSGIRTAGGNQISMQDREGSQRIVLQAGDGKSRIICGSGSPSNVTTLADYQHNANKFFFSASDIMTTVLSSLGFNATSGSFVPRLSASLLNTFSKEIADYDKLIHQETDAAPEYKYGGQTELILSISGKVLSNILNAWALRTMGDRIARSQFEAVAEREFGQACRDFRKHWKDNKWTGKSKLLLSTMGKLAMNFLVGSAGDYGAVLFSHCPSDSAAVNWLLDPRCASMLNLSKASPNVLVAASNGVVDIFGAKGLSLVSDDIVNIESKTAAFQAEERLSFQCGAGILQLISKEDVDLYGAEDRSGIVFEFKRSLIELFDERAIFSLRESPKEDKKSARVEITVEGGGPEIRTATKRTLIRSLDQGDGVLYLRTGQDFLSDDSEVKQLGFQDPAMIAIKGGDGHIDLRAKDVVDIDSQNDLFLDGKNVKLGSIRAENLKLGSAKAKLDLKGSNVKIGADQKIMIG